MYLSKELHEQALWQQTLLKKHLTVYNDLEERLQYMGVAQLPTVAVGRRSQIDVHSYCVRVRLPVEPTIRYTST
jgi:hypothetical protein